MDVEIASFNISLISVTSIAFLVLIIAFFVLMKGLELLLTGC